MFSFVFDKKSLTLLLAGLLIAGGLLFFAGLLVGVSQGLPTGTAVAYVRPVPAKQPEPCVEPIVPEPAPAPAAPLVEEPAPEPQIAEKEPPPPVPAIEKPEPEPRPVLAAYHEPEPVTEGRFSVQVGAFRSKENSEAVIRELESRGYQPYVVERTTATRRVLHTVRIGRYADRREALRAAAEFRNREKMSAIVERVGSS
ncbi:MAG TPA: SPOR domain-containing protein [Thermoanaerobaculia bacterium]